jgi:hypothetical protein
MNEFPLDDVELAINDTTKLKGLLNVLSEEVEITLDKVDNESKSLKLSDKDGSKINYALAELDIIPTVPKLKNIPDFNLEIPLTKEFIARFSKAKSALSGVDTFTILQEEKNTSIIIGYSPDINSDRISINVLPTVGKDVIANPLSFSAKYLKEILSANAEQTDAILKVSDAGMAYVEFGTEKSEFQSKYYLIKIELS